MKPPLSIRMSYFLDRFLLTNFSKRNNPLIQKLHIIAEKCNEEEGKLRRGRKRRNFRLKKKSALVSSFNSILVLLKYCNTYLRPAYFDEDWEVIIHTVEIDCVLGGLIKTSAYPQETFNNLVSASYSVT